MLIFIFNFKVTGNKCALKGRGTLPFVTQTGCPKFSRSCLMVPHPSLPRVLNWQILLPGSILMHGFAFQVDKLVAEIEDHQLLHELSLEDDVDAEELPSELNLSAVSSVSSMSGVAPLPLDPASDNPVQESGVAQLPPDELDFGVIENIPVLTASSTPICLSAPLAAASSCVRASLHAILSKSPGVLSDSSYSSESEVMEEEQVTVVQADIQEGPGVVGPDSQTVESVAPQKTQTASLLVSTKAVIHPLPSDAVSPQSTSSAINLPQTPQHILPTLLQEAASSDVLSAAGWSEDPASTVQESVLEGLPSCSSDLTSAIPGALSTPLGSNHAPVGGMTVSDEAVHALSPALSSRLVPGQDSMIKDPPVGQTCDQEKTDGCTHPVSPSTPAGSAVPLSGSSTLDHSTPSGQLAQDLHLSASPSPSPAEQLEDPLRKSPVCSSSPGWLVDLPVVTEKLALVDPHPSGSGQVTSDPSDSSTIPDASKAPSPHDSSPLPDQAEPSRDSSMQLQPQEESSLEAQKAECDAYVSGALDVTLESRAQVPMDRAIVERLRGEAAKGVALWNDCLSHMTVNKHPHCDFPHVYGVGCDMQYYIKTKVPDYKESYDEFHNLLLCNDLTAEVVEQTDPFVVRHVVARLLNDEHTLPAELLPSLGASLCSHRHALVACRDSLLETVKDMDRKLHQISLDEAALSLQVEALFLPGGTQIPASSLRESNGRTPLQWPMRRWSLSSLPSRLSWRTSSIYRLLTIWPQTVGIIRGNTHPLVPRHSVPLISSAKMGCRSPSGFEGVNCLGTKLCRSLSARRHP